MMQGGRLCSKKADKKIELEAGRVEASQAAVTKMKEDSKILTRPTH